MKFVIPEKPEIRAKCDALFKRLEPLNRGDWIEHADIEAVLGIERYGDRWTHHIRRIIRRMERERGITLINVPDVGYKLATVQEQIEQGGYRMTRATRQLRRGKRSLLVLEGETNLTAHQKRFRAASLASLRETEQSLVEHINTTTVLAKPTPTSPRVYRATSDATG